MRSDDDAIAADTLYREARTLARAVEADSKWLAASARLKELQAALRRPRALLLGLSTRLSSALTAYQSARREIVAQRAAEAASTTATKAAPAAVASAVERALAADKASRRESGQTTTTQEYWHAEVDSVGDLVAAIVAGNDGLWERAKVMRRGKRPSVDPGVLLGLRSAKSTLAPYPHITSPGLNELATRQRTALSIPGVRAVSAETVVAR